MTMSKAGVPLVTRMGFAPDSSSSHPRGWIVFYLAFKAFVLHATVASLKEALPAPLFGARAGTGATRAPGRSISPVLDAHFSSGKTG